MLAVENWPLIFHLEQFRSWKKIETVKLVEKMVRACVKQHRVMRTALGLTWPTWTVKHRGKREAERTKMSKINEKKKNLFFPFFFTFRHCCFLSRQKMAISTCELGGIDLFLPPLITFFSINFTVARPWIVLFKNVNKFHKFNEIMTLVRYSSPTVR